MSGWILGMQSIKKQNVFFWTRSASKYWYAIHYMYLRSSFGWSGRQKKHSLPHWSGWSLGLRNILETFEAVNLESLRNIEAEVISCVSYIKKACTSNKGLQFFLPRCLCSEKDPPASHFTFQYTRQPSKMRRKPSWDRVCEFLSCSEAVFRSK